jgi:hypothetical protein
MAKEMRDRLVAFWAAWRALLAGFYGLPLDEEELALFQRITSIPGPAQAALLELWLAVGRRRAENYR